MKIIISLVSFILFNQSFALETKDSKMPLELRFLISCIPDDLVDNSFVNKFNSSVGALSEKDLFFLSKSEIYKSLLNPQFDFSKVLEGQERTIDQSPSSVLKEIMPHTSIFCPFERWVIYAMSKDFTQKNNPQFFRFLNTWMHYLRTYGKAEQKVMQTFYIHIADKITRLSSLFPKADSTKKPRDLIALSNSVSSEQKKAGENEINGELDKLFKTIKE